MTVAVGPDGGLSIAFDQTPRMEGALEPLGGDRFRTRWRDPNIENAYVDFATTAGAVRAVTLKAISPLADFRFDYQDLHFAPATGGQAMAR